MVSAVSLVLAFLIAIFGNAGAFKTVKMNLLMMALAVFLATVAYFSH